MKPDQLPLDEIYVASWNNEGHNDDSNLITYSVEIIDEKKCMVLLTPVLELRFYEFCTTLKDKLNSPLEATYEHVKNTKKITEWGAAIINLRKKLFIGFFTWGERQPQALPIVSLNITYYSKWLDSILL